MDDDRAAPGLFPQRKAALFVLVIAVLFTLYWFSAAR
jgi:hypothetical protein